MRLILLHVSVPSEGITARITRLTRIRTCVCTDTWGVGWVGVHRRTFALGDRRINQPTAVRPEADAHLIQQAEREERTNTKTANTADEHAHMRMQSGLLASSLYVWDTHSHKQANALDSGHICYLRATHFSSDARATSLTSSYPADAKDCS